MCTTVLRFKVAVACRTRVGWLDAAHFEWGWLVGNPLPRSKIGWLIFLRNSTEKKARQMYHRTRNRIWAPSFPRDRVATTDTSIRLAYLSLSLSSCACTTLHRSYTCCIFRYKRCEETTACIVVVLAGGCAEIQQNKLLSDYTENLSIVLIKYKPITGVSVNSIVKSAHCAPSEHCK